MERHIETADYILVVCTETYKRRAKREEAPGVGRGVKWESVLIYQNLYDADSLNTKFIPVLFDSTDEPHILRPLRGVTHYRVDTKIAAISQLINKHGPDCPANTPTKCTKWPK